MRLINTTTLALSEVQITRFLYGRTEPKYTILSHTWGHEEVSFEEWVCAIPPPQGSPFTIWTALKSIIGLDVRSNVTKKRGYAKISEAARIAAKDGYQWLWVDTCCINKSSSAESSESINSMFRWY